MYDEYQVLLHDSKVKSNTSFALAYHENCSRNYDKYNIVIRWTFIKVKMVKRETLDLGFSKFINMKLQLFNFEV